MKKFFAIVTTAFFLSAFAPTIIWAQGVPQVTVDPVVCHSDGSTVSFKGMVNPNGYQTNIKAVFWLKASPDEKYESETVPVEAGDSWVEIIISESGFFSSDWEYTFDACNQVGCAENTWIQEFYFPWNVGVKEISSAEVFLKDGGTIDLYDLMGRHIGQRPSGQSSYQKSFSKGIIYLEVLSINGEQKASRKISFE